MLSEEEKKEGDVGEEREESLKNPNGDGRWKYFAPPLARERGDTGA